MFCPTGTWGGVEKNVRLRAKELGEKGYSFKVVLLKNQFKEKFEGLKNVEIISVEKRGGDINLFVVQTYVRILKKYRPSVVFAALKKDWFLVSLSAHLAKIQRIILYLGIQRKIRNGLKYQTVFKKLNAKVLVNSDDLKQDLIHQNPMFTEKNVFRIYNGFNIPSDIPKINLKQRFNLPENTYVIGCAGRFSPQKGFDLLPEILENLSSHCHVVIAGEYDSKNPIYQALINSSQKHRIHFLGYLDNILPFMNALDLFLLPSRREGMANVLNEAMSVGKPIVATQVSGSKELLQDGEYGVLCPIEDTNAIVKAILDIVENKKSFSPKNQIHRIRESFSLERMIVQTEHLFFEDLNTFKELD